MRRTKFTIIGTHPLLHLVRNRLILSGYELVQDFEELDFCIVGCDLGDKDPTTQLVQILSNIAFLHDVPTILLSTGDVYSDRTDTLLVSEDKPMTETRVSVIPYSLDPIYTRALFALFVENLFFSKYDLCVLRIFDVYGPSINEGVVHNLIQSAYNKEALKIPSPGYQTNCYLYEEDFLTCIDKLIIKFLKGARGIYNIGSNEEISMKRLAESVGHMFYKDNNSAVIELYNVNTRNIWWKKPDITRICALTKWSPSTTIRKGLWETIQKWCNNGYY